MAEQIFEKQFAGITQSVFRSQSAFQPAFGEMQVIDGVSNNAKMFALKTSDMPVVIGQYSTDPNVAFGTGTGNSTRFGQMQEVTYKDEEVPYDGTWTMHEGLDDFTLNADFQSALADRLDAQAQAKVRQFNKLFGQKLLDASSEDLGSVSDVVKTFGKAAAKYTNLEVTAPIRAYVDPETYNAIVDSTLTTTAKGSAVNIDENGAMKLKGITITQVPEQYMGGAKIIFLPDGIGKAFLGINVVRALDASDFKGVELQGAGKYGAWVSDVNKKAILTAGYTKPSSTTTSK